MPGHWTGVAIIMRSINRSTPARSRVSTGVVRRRDLGRRGVGGRGL